MPRLRIGAAARADLAAIRRYSIGEFGPDVADAYFRGFNRVFDLLRVHPSAGAAQPDIAADARSYNYRRHRILYRIDGEVIVVVRILHHAQTVRWPS